MLDLERDTGDVGGQDLEGFPEQLLTGLVAVQDDHGLRLRRHES